MVLSANNFVFLIDFINSHERFMVNNQNGMLELFKMHPSYAIHKIRVLDHKTMKFGRTNKEFLLAWSSWNTELNEILKQIL